MKKLLLLCLLCVCLLGFAACGSPADSGEVELINPDDPIVIGILPDTQSVPVALADYLGYFEEEGVNVRVEKFSSAPDRDSAIQSGNLNAMISDLVAVLLYREGGFDVHAVLSTDGSQQLMASAESGIQSIEEAAGRTITLSENTIMDYATTKIFEYYQLPLDGVDYNYIPQMTVRMEMLETGKIDLATMPEPQVSIAKASGAVVLASSEDVGINAGCLAMTDEILTAEPDAVRAFLAAYNRAVDYLNEKDSAEYMDTVIAQTGLPESVSDTISLPSYRRAELPTEDDFTQVLAWMNERGLLANSYAYSDAVSGEFLGE